VQLVSIKQKKKIKFSQKIKKKLIINNKVLKILFLIIIMNLILESKMLNFITMKNLIKITPKINKTNNNLIIIMIFFKIKMIFFKIKMIFLVMKAKIIKMKMLKILKKDFLNKVQYLIIIRKDFHNKALFRIIKITTNPYKKKKPKQ
jgi:hypothetical protein